MRSFGGQMSRRALSGVFALVPGGAWADDTEEAVALLGTMGLNQNLPAMLGSVAAETTTFQTAISQLGPERARDQLFRQIAAVAPRYQSRWEQNLAAAHLERLSLVELRSLAREQGRSLYIHKFLAVRPEIGRSMERLSGKLLEDAVAEVLRDLAATIPRAP